MSETDTGIKMDEEVKKELSAIESRLSLSMEKLVLKAITDGFKGVENILTKLFNKDIGHIQEWIDTLKNYHQDHYTETASIRKDMTGMRTSISEEITEKTAPLSKRLDNLEVRQLTDEVTVQAIDKKENKKIEKTNINLVIIGLIITSVGILSAWIGSLF